MVTALGDPRGARQGPWSPHWSPHWSLADAWATGLSALFRGRGIGQEWTAAPRELEVGDDYPGCTDRGAAAWLVPDPLELMASGTSTTCRVVAVSGMPAEIAAELRHRAAGRGWPSAAPFTGQAGTNGP